MKKYTACSILLFSVLAGCTTWPDSTGHLYIKHGTEKKTNNKTLKQLLLISENRLQLLAKSDAKTCIPGQIEKAQRMLTDIRKNKQLNFKETSQRKIAALLRHLDKSHQLYEQISQKSLCTSDQDNEINKDHLSRLINCNCRQVDNQGKLTPEFKKRINHFVKKIKQFDNNLHISIYTSREKSHILPTYHYLIDRGIKKNNISLHHKTKDLRDITRNAIAFQLIDTSNNKITRIKDWHSHYSIQSAILERQNEPIH